jgi:hypothetical protein
VLQATDSGTTFGMFAVLTTILNKNLYALKTAGFLGIKADVILRLQVNANPFQAGRYFLCFIPTVGANPNAVHTGYYLFAHRFSAVQCSQLPHAEIDLNCDTECILKIPFNSCDTMYSLRSATLADGMTDIGAVFMRPYSSLITVAGSSTVSYTLWGSLENIELFGPTVPQSGRRGTVSEQELSRSKLGPISGALNRVSRAANIISEIPLLSEFASMTSFFADVGARAAKVFGYAKPDSRQPPNNIIRTIFPNAYNVDGISSGYKLALSERNELAVLPGFAGSKFDEMSIDYIKTIPSYFTNVVWNDTQNSETELIRFNLNPSYFAKGHNDSGNEVVDMTPMCWVAAFFGLYRGSIVLRFKFVKTCFHSGRLMFTFIPTDPRFTNPDTTTPALFDYANRQIVDIRDGNEFTLAFPYTANQNYLTNGVSYGQVVISVLDPLKAPATVSSSVPILCEAWGGADLEFASPTSISWEPYLPSAAQSSDPCNLEYSTVGGMNIVTSDIYAKSCIGEKILSLRSLIKCAVPLPEYNGTIQTGNEWFISPWTFLWTKFVGPTGVARPKQPADYLTAISAPFSTFRGSMRFYGDTNDNTRWKANSWYAHTVLTGRITTGSTAAGTDYRNFAMNKATVIGNTSMDGGINFSIPYYNAYHSTPVADTIFAGLSLDPNEARTHKPKMIYMLSTQVPVTVNFSRFAGDDFSFGGFVSVPPMILTAPFLSS